MALRWAVMQDAPASVGDKPPKDDAPRRGSDAAFLGGGGVWLLLTLSLFFLPRVPEAAREILVQAVLSTSGTAGVLVLGALAATAAAAAIVREIGHARIVAAAGLVRSLGPTSVLAALALTLPPLGSIGLFLTMGVTGPWLREHELGLLIYVAAFATLAGLALLPTYAQAALGGFAFGVMFGVPAALLGFAGAALIGYELARRFSGDRAERVIAQNPKWKAVRDGLLGQSREGGPQANRGWVRTAGIVALLRLPPNSPFALTNLVMASVKVPRLPFAVGTVLGMAPRTTLAVVIGAGVNQLTRDDLDQAVPTWVVWVGMAVTLAVVVLVGVIASRAVKKMTRAGGEAADTISS